MVLYPLLAENLVPKGISFSLHYKEYFQYMIQDEAEKILKDSKVGKFHNKNKFIMRQILVGCMVFLFVIFGFFFFYRRVTLLLEQQSSFFMKEVATKSAERLEEKINGDLRMLEGLALYLGGLDYLDVDHWLEVINDDPFFSEFQRIGFMLPDGRLYTSEVYGVDFSDRPYFQAIKQGQTVLSDVFIDNVYHKPTLVYAVPIIQNQEVVGGIGFGIVIQEYEKYLHMPSFAGEGSMHLLDKNGSIILKLGNSVIPKMLSLETLQQDFSTGKSGIVCLEDPYPRVLAYAPVGVQGWSLLLEVPHSFFVETQKRTTLNALVMAGILGLFLLYFHCSSLFKQRRYENSLLRLAYIDKLTGAANYALFVEGAERLIVKEGPGYACIILNIRRFKLINDLFGYSYGDSMLQQIASMLPSFCMDKELYGRRGGDRFLLFFKQGDIEKRVQDLLSVLNKITLPDTACFKLDIVAGIFSLNKPMPINICIDRATLALDHLEDDHGSSYLVYDEAIREQLLEESELVKCFQEALLSDQFLVVLQPKFNMETSRVIGAEALVRWNHPTKGFLAPLKFIPVFEEHHLITELDMFVLRRVCEKLRQWQAQGLAVLPISVNQSRAHLDNPSYVTDLIHEVDLYGIDHSLLEFEMTESIFLGNLDQLKAVVSNLRKVGFSISIDDFGSGYSSLNMLKNIKVDFLKLDREFLMKAEDDLRSQKVIHRTIQMAHDLDILIVAEGVETKKQVEMLLGMNCTMAQGYYYERPIPMDVFEKLLVKLP